MTIRSTPGRPLPVVVGSHPCGVINVLGYPHVLIVDDTPQSPEILFGIVAHGVPADVVGTWAERVAELLEVHGLVDVDDDISEATP